MVAKYDCAGNIIILTDDHSINRFEGRYDQLIKFDLPNNNLVNVEIFNNDGSSAKNCLNGLRALSHLLFNNYELKEPISFFQHGKLLAIGANMNNSISVVVPMPLLKSQSKDVDFVNIGNDHMVYWMIGDQISKSSGYVPKINEEYISAIEGDDLKTTVFEAGVGATGSCGSGAVAVGVSAYKRLGKKNVQVVFPGGKLFVKVDEDNVSLSGPTVLLLLQ